MITRPRILPRPEHAPPRAPYPPPGAVWNGLRRLWLLDGVPLDPQPPALVLTAQTPPAVKVDL